ncbi:MAG: hybrid sensor histidine kinase/response regulator [Anaerolineae bacterium]|nr:hybrid sensor histidine kinase/response regulator [Anaerolineae bacterium]
MKRILVIEDEASLREDIVDILRLADFEVLDAENGLVGAAQAKEHKPDLILCDIMMPERSGDWVLLEVRSDPGTAHIPFIFLTARTSRSDMRYGMELGADDYITKPFTPDELLSAVNARITKQAHLEIAQTERLRDLHQSIARALPHELRTPLTGILGYARIMMEDAEELDTSQMRQMAQGIQRASRRLRRLVENYLLFAQLEMLSNQMVQAQVLLQETCTAPQEILQTVVEQQATEAKRPPEDLEVHCEAVSIRIDETSFAKIAEELLDNALKFSQPGTRVQIHGIRAGERFHLVVRDQGRGMNSEQIQRIDAYMQFDRRLYEHAGLGFGLAIVRHLATLYQGSFQVSSVPGQFTEVRVQLPLAT